MNAADFRAAMAALPEPATTETPPHWSYWRRNLWQLAQTDSAANFWNWPAVRHTMLVEHFPLGEQLAALQAADWPRWEAALSGLGNDAHYRNLVNQAYHVLRWEQATGLRLEQLGSIYEFGGGYGALAHLARRLGFAGRYLIYDLPEFVLLQRYFLASVSVEVQHVTAPQEADLFVALYSLSETPADFRRQFGREVWAQSYLLLYSGRWAEHDNVAWAEEFRAWHGDAQWLTEQYPGRPDFYAFGW